MPQRAKIAAGLPRSERKTHRLPHAAQTGFGIPIDQRRIAVAEEFEQRAIQNPHVRCGEVQALGPGWRHDVRGVAREAEPPEAHRLRDEAAQRRHALFDRRAGDETFGRFRRQACTQFVPEAGIGPALDLLVGRALHVVAAARGRPHAAEGETASVIRVDQFVGHGRRIAQDAEPAEGIDALERRERMDRDTLAAHAVKAVAAGDELAGDLLITSALAIADARLVRIEVVDAGLVAFEAQLAAALEARVDQVLGHLGLPVDRHRSARVLPDVDTGTPAVECDLKAVVDEARAIETRADAGLLQEIDRTLFQHPCADAALHVLSAALLDDDVVDAALTQELRQQQARGPRADDADLSGFVHLPRSFRCLPTVYIRVAVSFSRASAI